MSATHHIMSTATVALLGVFLLASLEVSTASAQTLIVCPSEFVSCQDSDLLVGPVTATPIPGEYCSSPVDSILINISTIVEPQGGRSKYEIGFWIPVEPGGFSLPASDCWADLINPEGADLEPNPGGTAKDLCNDLDGAESISQQSTPGPKVEPSD